MSPRCCMTVLVAFLGISVSATVRAGEPPAGTSATTRPVLNLVDGGFASGRLVESSNPGLIRWQADEFTEPFEFPITRLNAVHYPLPPTLPKATGDFCFELAGGDVLFGSLVSLDQKIAELEVPRLGRLHVNRSNIHRLYPWRGTDLIYLGPNGLNGWHESAAKKVWKEEQGQPWTDQDGGLIRSDFQIPPRASIEFEISWKNKPDFVLALGVDEEGKQDRRAFRFEVWERDLVVQRETAQEADVESVGEIAPGPGRIHLSAYLDQQQGRILVFTPAGKPLADLKVAEGNPMMLGKLSLLNKRGDLKLERLRIGRWNGEPPLAAEGSKARIHRVDGSIAYGQVTRFDPSARRFSIREQGGEVLIPQDQVSSVFLSLPGNDQPRMLRAVFLDGVRLSGDLVKAERDAVVLSIPGFRESPRVLLNGLRSLVGLSRDASPASTQEQSGMLETEGAKLRGRLLDGKSLPDASCLVWKPRESQTASPLRYGVSGRIVYREQPPPAPRPSPNIRRVQQPQGPAGFVAGFLSALSGNQGSGVPAKRRCIFLRSGDVIPSDVTRIDDQGVHFRTALSESTFVRHDKVQAVELAQETNLIVKVNPTKRERLLTLPRMQRDNPPTHLIRAKTGDYLRGRLTQMDEKSLKVEIRLEPREIPRDRVARIIWLHPEDLDPAKKAANASHDPGAMRVQTVRNDGIRLTYQADQLSGGVLSGKSDVLGVCKVGLKDVDQLLIGGAIEKAAAQLTYQRWRLQNALEPRVAEGNSGSTGTESAMVGKPAPDFELDLLSGGKFKLSRNKGKVIVLDFWATWCGPCLQTMPLVEKVVREFPERDVQLLAVNLQEEEKPIKAMLERHRLTPTVGLDIDGVVSDRYAATAIPQTVIIDRNGAVSRLFVGGGPQLEGQLRDSIKPLIGQAAASATDKPAPASR